MTYECPNCRQRGHHFRADCLRAHDPIRPSDEWFRERLEDALDLASARDRMARDAGNRTALEDVMKDFGVEEP